MPFAEAAGCRIYYETHGPKPGERTGDRLRARRRRQPPLVVAAGAPLPRPLHLRRLRPSRLRPIARCRGRPGRRGVRRRSARAARSPRHRARHARRAVDGRLDVPGFALRHPERVERLMMCDTHGGMRSARDRCAVVAKRCRTRRRPARSIPAAGERMYREQPALHFLYQEISGLNPHNATRTRCAVCHAASSERRSVSSRRRAVHRGRRRHRHPAAHHRTRGVARSRLHASRSCRNADIPCISSARRYSMRYWILLSRIRNRHALREARLRKRSAALRLT